MSGAPGGEAFPARPEPAPTSPADRKRSGGGRGSGGVLALGLASLLAAWTFGSVSLAAVAAGLVLAGLGARAWTRVARGGSAERLLGEGAYVEGDDVRVEVVLRRRLLAFGGAVAVQALGPGRVAQARLRRGRGTLVLEQIPRGRYVLEPARVVLGDPLGLERVVLAAGAPAALVVRPSLVELRGLFTDSGRQADGGRRALLRRQSGFELHAIRDHREGESLRSVHWPSTARRARLMVKELDDAPRDEVTVVLDQDRAGLAGPAGQSSFDAAVRAAGSIVRAHAARGRRVALVLSGSAREPVRVCSLGRDWEAALVALAAAEADSEHRLAGVLAAAGGVASRAPELVVVTCLAGAATDVLGGRRAGRAAGLVLIDAPTFAGAPPAAPAGALLRAAAAGVGVSVVRRGDDLRAVLEGPLLRSVSA